MESKKQNHEYYEEKIEKIREVIKTNSYPPIFNRRKWLFKKLNCYSYALDINESDLRRHIWIPGCIAEEKEDRAIYGDVTEEIKKDLEFLGMKYREDDGYLRVGEYRIAIYSEPTYSGEWTDFHVSRQDKDGTWSEKPNWVAGVQKVDNSTDIPKDLSNHNLILEGTLIISKVNP